VRFLLLDGLAALISVPAWVYLGYAGADNRAWLAMWIGRGQHGAWLVGASLAVALLAWWWRRRRRRPEADC
jgi:membrane protein DedA with SNARE-associated domain